MREILRYYLEIRDLKDLIKVKAPNKDIVLQLVKKPDFSLNKFFYKQIGKNHRWIDRLSWTDQTWNNYISNNSVKTYILKEGEELAGYFELIHNKDNNENEIAYFGILEEYRNKRYGAYLLSKAIELSLIKHIKRVWVHTCTLDHKNAIKNYLSRGMKIFKEEKIKISA